MGEGPQFDEGTVPQRYNPIGQTLSSDYNRMSLQSYSSREEENVYLIFTTVKTSMDRYKLINVV